MGRLGYYFLKARSQFKSRGLIMVFGTGLNFLWRRKFFLGFIYESLEYHVLSRFRSIDATVIQVIKQEILQSQKVMIYSTFDSESKIQESVVQQLSFFHQAGYQNIWVSTSQTVPDTEFSKIKNLVSVAVHRKNQGYDFVSYGVGFSFLNLKNLTSLVVMNDSCVGPLFDFLPILAKMERESKVVYGLTKSYEIAEYLQSYFYHFGSELIRSPVMKPFFTRIRILNSKWAIVRFLEIGSSQFLRRHGVLLKALIDPAEPSIGSKMKEYQLTDPVKDPAGKEWVKLGLNPFYKRSNLI